MEKLRFAPYKEINSRNISAAEIALAAFEAVCWCLLIKDMFDLSFELSGETIGTFGGGLIYVWNRIAETLGNTSYTLLPEFEGASDSGVLFLPVIFVAAALMQYLAKNIKYPTIAQENGTQGRVIVQFVVNRDGSIVDAKVVRSVDPYLDKEALRVINTMPKWKPGMQRGKPVRVKFTVPVMFRLQ